MLRIIKIMFKNNDVVLIATKLNGADKTYILFDDSNAIVFVIIDIILNYLNEINIKYKFELSIFELYQNV